MPTPKSVVKINKSGVTYISNADMAEYYIFELARAALRDVGKYVCKMFQKKYYEHFRKQSGDGGKAVKYKVYSSKTTKYPRVEIGLKTGKVPGFYSLFQEFGSSKTPRLGLLSASVNENISEIVKIESQYLSGLEDEAEKLAISEDDYEGGADD